MLRQRLNSKNQQLLITLDALQAIAHYVSAVPGTQESHLVCRILSALLPRDHISKVGCPYEDQIKKTIDALAAARVSVYPIEHRRSHRLPNSDIGGAGTDAGGSLVPEQVLCREQMRPVHRATRNSHLSLHETWAEATGGIATHHNDLKGALAEDIQNGSSYYTVAYTPTDPREIGRERKITVRLKDAEIQALLPPQLLRTHLRPKSRPHPRSPRKIRSARSWIAACPTSPTFTSACLSSPIPHRHLAGAPPNGDNAALKPPFKRYTVRFFLSPENLNLVESPDGVRRAPVEVALIAYSQRGESLNWLVRSVNLAIRPDQMAFAESSGIPFHFDFDMPPGDVYLRAGVYDPSTERAGTLEIPRPHSTTPPQPSGSH